MNDTNANKLKMIGSSITLAESTDYRPVWDGKAPAAFGTDLAALKAGRQATLDLAAKAASDITGAADDKADAETALENAAFTLARAAANHFKKTGDLTRRAKVDFTKGAIQKLREQALVSTASDILATASTATAEPGAADRGVTPAAIAAVNKAIGDFNGLLTQPRGGIASRAAMNREIETRVAGHMEDIADLDDLVIQFGGTDAGQRFIAAWKQARIIVDAGHGPADDKPAPTGITTPATTAKPAPGA